MKKIFFIVSIFVTAVINGQNTLRIMQGARLIATGGALVTLEDMNLDNNGELNNDTYNNINFPPSSIFRFSGNITTDISQSITGPKTATFFDRLEIAKGRRVFTIKTLGSSGLLRSSVYIRIV